MIILIYIFNADNTIDVNYNLYKPLERLMDDIDQSYKLYHLEKDYKKIYNDIDKMLISQTPIIISGSFIDLSSSKEWFLFTRRIIKKLAENNHPLFGVCFGAQMIFSSFFKDSLYYGNVTEIGFLKVSRMHSLNFIGNQDFYLTFHNDGIKAEDIYLEALDGYLYNIVNGHKVLQYFKFKGVPIYGTQFHPELDIETYNNIKSTYSLKDNIEDKNIYYDIDVDLFKEIIKGMINVGANYEK